MQDKIKNNKEEELEVKNSNEKEEIYAKRRRAKRYIIIGGIIFLICVGYILYKESQIRDLNTQKTKLTNDYNELEEKHTGLENDYDKLNSEYSNLNKEYAKLQKAHKKLQNLPDVTVYADVDGKDVELTFYSTVEEAKDNVKNLEYENFFLDDVELIVSVHNKKQIEEIKRTVKGVRFPEVILQNYDNYSSKARQIDNGAYKCVLNTASEESNLLTLLIDNKKMYTVFRAIEIKK